MIPGPPPSDALGTANEEVEIYVFPPNTAAVSSWDPASRCALYLEDGSTMHIVANVAGLRSLARHFLTLAQAGQSGGHLDYDADSGWFEETDLGLRISRGWE